jgi:hypothetical protein
LQALNELHAQAAVIVKLTANKKAGGKGKKSSAAGNLNYWGGVVKRQGMTGVGAHLKVCVTPGPIANHRNYSIIDLNSLSRLRQVHRLVAAIQFNL